MSQETEREDIKKKILTTGIRVGTEVKTKLLKENISKVTEISKENSNIIKEATRYRTIIFYNKFNKKKIKLLKNLKVEFFKLSVDIDNNLDLHETLIKSKELGFYRIFLETGMKLTTSFLYKNLIDDFNLFVSDKNLVKNGENNIKKQLKLFLSNKKGINEKANLFGEKLIKYKIK